MWVAGRDGGVHRASNEAPFWYCVKLFLFQPVAAEWVCYVSCCCSFMLGYHVHEKAILMTLTPLALDTFRDAQAARIFAVLSVTGQYALLRLLFLRNEYPIKVGCMGCFVVLASQSCSGAPGMLINLDHSRTFSALLTSKIAVAFTSHTLHLHPAAAMWSLVLVNARQHSSAVPWMCCGNCKDTVGTLQVLIFLLYSWGSYAALHHCHRSSVQAQGAGVQAAGYTKLNPDLLSRGDRVYLLGLCAVEFYSAALHEWAAPRLEFLPLMVTSVYCSLGLAKGWLCLGHQLMCAPTPEGDKED